MAPTPSRQTAITTLMTIGGMTIRVRMATGTMGPATPGPARYTRGGIAWPMW